MSSARFSAQFFLCFTHFTPLTIICLRLHVDGKWRIIEIWVDFKAIAKIELERSGESGKNGKKETMAKGLASVERELCDLWRRLVCQTLPNYISTPILASLSDRTEKKATPQIGVKYEIKFAGHRMLNAFANMFAKKLFARVFYFQAFAQGFFRQGIRKPPSSICWLEFYLFFSFFFLPNLLPQWTHSALPLSAMELLLHFCCFLCCFVSG